MMTQQVETTKPSVKILITDNEKFVSQTRSVYNLYSDSILIFPKIKYSIMDANGSPLYKFQYSNFGKSGFLKDMNDNIVINFKLKTRFNYGEITIYHNNGEQTVVSMAQRNSFKKPKYDVSFYNRATGRSEMLDAQVISSNGSMSIYRGKQSSGGQLICTVHKFGFLKSTDSRIEIEPGVDKIAMLLISILGIRVVQNRTVALAA